MRILCAAKLNVCVHVCVCIRGYLKSLAVRVEACGEKMGVKSDPGVVRVPLYNREVKMPQVCEYSMYVRG